MEHTPENYKSFWTISDIENININKTQKDIKQLLSKQSNHEGISSIFVENIENWLKNNSVGRTLLRKDEQDSNILYKNADINSSSARMEEAGIVHDFVFSPQLNKEGECFNEDFTSISEIEVYSAILTSTVGYQEAEDDWILNLLKENTEKTILSESVKEGLLIAFKLLCHNGFLPRFIVLDVESYIDLVVEVGKKYIGIESLRDALKTKNYGRFEGVEIVVSCSTKDQTILMTSDPKYVGTYTPNSVSCEYKYDMEESSKGWYVKSNTKACIVNKEAIAKISLMK